MLYYPQTHLERPDDRDAEGRLSLQKNLKFALGSLVYVPDVIEGSCLEGCRCAAPHSFTGRVDAVFLNFQAAVNSGLVDGSWWDKQEHKPSTKHQTFYSVISSRGSILAGESELLAVCGGAGDVEFEGALAAL